MRFKDGNAVRCPLYPSEPAAAKCTSHMLPGAGYGEKVRVVRAIVAVGLSLAALVGKPLAQDATQDAARVQRGREIADKVCWVCHVTGPDQEYSPILRVPGPDFHAIAARPETTAASLTAVKAEQALCMATGNTAKVFGLNTGFVREGMAADLVAMDAPMGSVGADALQAIEAGDVPGVSMVMIDGKIEVKVSRNTPPAARKAKY